MTNDTTTPLQMRWLPVTSPDGRTHMECVWLAPAQVSERLAPALPAATSTAASGPAAPVVVHAA